MATAKIGNVGNVGTGVSPSGIYPRLPTFLPGTRKLAIIRMLAGNVGSCQDSIKELEK
jgi:hypothetical protein